MWLTLSLLIGSGTVFNCSEPEGQAGDRYRTEFQSEACAYYRTSINDKVTIRVLSVNTSLDQKQMQGARSLHFSPVRRGRAKGYWEFESGQAYFSLNVEIYRKGYVFKKNTHAFQDINESDLLLAEVNIAKLAKHELPIESFGNGYVTNKFVREGSIATSKNLVNKPLIRKNQEIDILVSYKNLVIQARGTSHEYGWQTGEKIKVRVDKADEDIMAKVISEGIVSFDM